VRDRRRPLALLIGLAYHTTPRPLPPAAAVRPRVPVVRRFSSDVTLCRFGSDATMQGYLGVEPLLPTEEVIRLAVNDRPTARRGP
jgi:hypothetical protein